MKFAPKHFAVLLLGIALGLPLAAFPQTDAKSPAQIVQQVLRGPERKELPLKVQILPPRLTYQQRYLVELRAVLPISELHRNGTANDLYFMLKVADEQGHWFEDDAHNHYVVPPELSKHSEIQFVAGLYARPGKYVATLAGYDSTTGQATRWQGTLKVPELKNDPLPAIDRNLPTIEFIREIPKASVPTTSDSLEELLSVDDEWPLGQKREWLPVPRGRPLRVDVVVNFSQRVDPREKVEKSAFAFRQTMGRLLQIGSVLSHLDVQSGCVRVSVVDTLRMKVMFDRANGRDLDWEFVGSKFSKQEQGSVDVHTLENRTQASAFLHDFLKKIETDRSGCGSDATPERAIVVAASPVAFPEGTKMQRLDPECDCRYFYVHTSTAGLVALTDRRGRPRGRAEGVVWPREWPGTRVVPVGDSTDDIEAMLKPAKPRSLSANNPRQFRSSLAQLISELAAPTRNTPGAN